MESRPIFKIALLLSMFASAGTGIVAVTEKLTQERIAVNERTALRQIIDEVLPPASYNNLILKDTIKVTGPTLLGTASPVLAYRARWDGQPVAVVLTPVAPNGYNGPIKLLVGIRYNGRLTGVRIISHQETPGLGDKIEAEKSSWILGFTGHSLGNPPEAQWKVKQDGGSFDQFTGATITPRAVVKAVRNALKYFRHHREALFAQEERNYNGATPEL